MVDSLLQRELSGSTSKVVTQSGLIKSGQGVLRGITTTATSSGTLVVVDGTEAGAAATSTLTSSGALVAGSHASATLTSTGASVPGTHAVTVFTNAGTQFKDAVKASAILTSDQTQPTAGKKVVVGDETYTFIAAGLTGSRFQVPLGVDCAATVLELYKAISNNPLVDTVLTSTYVITVTAKTAGTAGNSIAATEDDAHLDWDGSNTTLTGGLAAETVTIGTTVYKFRDVLQNAYDVKIGTSIELSLANLYYAINGTGTAGVNYCEGTVAHTQVIAVAKDATTVTLRGRVPGISLNGVATTETCAAASFPDTTLGGGTGASDAGVTTANATVTIDTTVYTVVDALSETYGATAVPYQVLKGVSEATMLDNLKAAINGTGTAGTEYSTGTVAHPLVVATTNANDSQIIRSRTPGVGNNTIATTDTLANTAWGGTTLGGAGNTAGVTTAAATFTIGTRTYTIVAELSETLGASAIADQILKGANEAAALANIKKALNGAGLAGTDYSTGTTINTQVEGAAVDATTLVANSRLLGVAGNSIVTTETLANTAWTGGTLASGTGVTGKLLLNTTTPAAGGTILIPDLEFENGLYITVGGTSISATVTYK